MKSYAHICRLIGNIIGLIYTFYRWFGITFAIISNNWNLAKGLYMLIPIGLSAVGTIIGLLFIFSERFFKSFSILMILSAMNAGFLMVEFLFYILPNANFEFDSFMYTIAMGQVLYPILTIISIIGANNKI